MDIHNATYLVSSAKVEQCPKPDKPEYAFIGRSNVGKSSLINLITGNSKLAKVSKSPGKTQLINHFLINGERNADIPWFLVDLPGYGFAKRSQSQRAQWEKMIANYFQQRPNLVTVFVLIDSRHSPQKIDIDFLANLGVWGIPFNIVFTKSDKSTQAITSKNVKSFVNRMKEEWEYIPRNFVTSTIKQTGKKELLAYIGELNEGFDPDAPVVEIGKG